MPGDENHVREPETTTAAVNALRMEHVGIAITLAAVHAAYIVNVYLESVGKPSADYLGQVDVRIAVSLTLFYVALIFVGPRLMEGVKPFNVKEYMLVYNMYQTALNAVIVIGLWSDVLRVGWPWWFQPIDTTATGASRAFFIWLHYNNKVSTETHPRDSMWRLRKVQPSRDCLRRWEFLQWVEYCDTIFIILRGNTKQLTFLHCHHHLLMGWVWMSVVLFGNGGARRLIVCPVAISPQPLTLREGTSSWCFIRPR